MERSAGAALLVLLGLCCIAGPAQGRVLAKEPAQEGANDLCETCRDVALQVEVFLTDPAALNQTLVYLETMACSNLPGSMDTQCKDLVETYVPQLFQTLQMEMQPDVLCVNLGVCKPGPHLPRVSQSRDQCALCEFFATDFLAFLDSNETRMHLVEAAHKACSHFQDPDAATQCNLIVDQYGAELLDVLQSLTPKEVCDLSKLCDGPSQQIQARAVLPNKEDNCVMCHFLVFEAKMKLKKPKTQVEVEKFLEETCSKVPNHASECKAMVEEYAPLVFQNLDVILDPEVICQKVGACKSRDLFIGMATQGKVAAK